MRRVAQGILKYRWLVLIFFAIALAVSFEASQMVRINFQLSDYLPDETESTVGLRIMEEEFNSKPSNLRILIEKVSIPEALVYKEKIAAVDGITDVTWLDDSVDVKQPLPILPKDEVNAWYKDGDALITAYLDSEKSGAAIREIRGIIGESNSMSGDIVQMTETRQRVQSDIKKIMALILPIIFLILILTTTSYFEPLLFLATIGAAILIGKGTDLFFGEISFVTSSCAAVLQLAVSMDYAIFLLEAFEENRRSGMDTQTAMTEAMVKAFSAITSSSVTTVFGFAAMLLMRFKIGYDLGVILAKDIAISLIATLVLLPVMAILLSAVIEKTHHRPFMPKMHRFGRLNARICIPVMLVVVLFVVAPSYLGSRQNLFLYGTNDMITNPAEKIVQEAARIDECYEKANLMVLLIKGGDPAREKRLVGELDGLDELSSIIAYDTKVGATIPVDFVGRKQVDALVGANYDRIILTANTKSESDEAYALVENIRKIARSYYPDESYLLGGTATTYDIRDVVRKDDALVDMLALLSIGLVLLFNFKSLILPFLLLMTIKASVWINLAVPYFSNSPIYYTASLIINAIQLGATVDYAILFTTRYMEMRKMMRKRDAVAATVTGTTSAILTSSSIMAVGGLTLGNVSSVGIVGQLGILVGRGAIISAAMVLLVLPALLMAFDPLIRILTIRPNFYRQRKDPHEEPKAQTDPVGGAGRGADASPASGTGRSEERDRIRGFERVGDDASGLRRQQVRSDAGAGDIGLRELHEDIEPDQPCAASDGRGQGDCAGGSGDVLLSGTIDIDGHPVAIQLTLSVGRKGN